MDRLTVFDRAELATDVGPNPRHITVLLVLGGPAPDVVEVRRRLERAVERQPRLRSRVHQPDGPCRVPTWEVGAVDLTRHVVHRSLPGADPLAVAVEDLARPLPADLPAWRLTVLDVGDARSALVWTSHHVLGNGPSLLGLLLDVLSDTPLGTAQPSPRRRPSPVPTGGVRARTGRAGRSPLQPLIDVTATYPGRTSVIPYSLMAAAVLYNREIFAQHGLTPPTTWTELLAVCETLEAAGVTPIYSTFKDPWTIAQGHFDYSVGGTVDTTEFFNELKR